MIEGRASQFRSDFMRRLEGKYSPPSSAVVLEDPTFLLRMPLINGVGILLNCVFLTFLAFANGEDVFGWSVVILTAAYLFALSTYLLTGRVGLYIHLMVWPSAAQNAFAIVILGGIVWSGGQLFWGIILAVICSLFLGRTATIVVAGCYILMAVGFGILEPTLQARRPQPALAITTGLAVDVFIVSVLLLVPIVITLVRQINVEHDRSERLLLNVLPRRIAHRLKRETSVIADAHESCTVLFADLVGFTDHSLHVTPDELVEELNRVFSRFDELVEACGAEKIKTMGDGYLAVAGAPTERPDHAQVMCDLALRMQEAMPDLSRELKTSLVLRVGVDTGPLVAGVVGSSRFSYDLWGRTVNMASRMQTMSPPGSIHVTNRVAAAAGDSFVFARHSVSEVKGVGPVETCLLVGRAIRADRDAAHIPAEA